MNLTPQERDRLKSLVPLDFLSAENFDSLVSQSSKIDVVPAGKLVFKKGDLDRMAVYLIDGEIELSPITKGDEPEIVKAGTDDGHHPLAPAQPRQCDAKALSDTKVIRIDTNTLDIMLTWDQEAGGMEVMEVDDSDDDEDSNDWMSKLLANKAFYKIPPANIHAVLTKMEPVEYDAGDVVIHQGDEGDYFYVIKSGHCEVIRETPRDPEGVRLATLEPGQSFGEDALISNNKRNATIKMLTPGVMMRLAKEDFVSLLTEPSLETITWGQANALAKKGAIWLDVRLPSEYSKSHIRSAVNLPLYFLRSKLEQINKKKVYMIYCDTGRRSSAASFVLKQAGIRALTVQGGLHAMASTATA